MGWLGNSGSVFVVNRSGAARRHCRPHPVVSRAKFTPGISYFIEAMLGIRPVPWAAKRQAPQMGSGSKHAVPNFSDFVYPVYTFMFDEVRHVDQSL